MRFKCFAVAALFMLLLIAILRPIGVANADSPAQDQQRALRIERTLACPQCTAVALDVCDQDICKDMRAIIQEKIVAGDSDEQIRQYFVARYGSRVLLAPPKNGRNAVAWLMPFLGLAAGGIAVYFFLRASRRSTHESALTRETDLALEPYRDRVELEIEQFE